MSMLQEKEQKLIGQADKPTNRRKGNAMKYTEKDLLAFIGRADTFEKLAIAEKWLNEHVGRWIYNSNLCEALMDQGLKLEREYERKKEIQGILKEIEEDDREMTRRKIYGC